MNPTENIKKRILIAPLNWGLGHASRCIPIVRSLLERGMEPILASDGMALLLLQKEFPQLKTYALPSYNIVYQSNNMLWNMAGQMPKIVRAIYQEQKAVEQIVRRENIALIISDNRYGCRSHSTRNILMTHQINIKIPGAILEQFVAWGNHHFIRRFDECWVPDFEEEPTLAGTLSRRNNLKNVRYIGALSRMKQAKVPRKLELLVVLSGPEPQRTYLEKKLLEEVQKNAFQSLFVRGLTDREERKKVGENFEVVSYLTSEDLNEAILSAEVILCRSGYSSIMDLVRLGKKAILIPTPGQTEQEYLAERFVAKNICCVQRQEDLNLAEAMKLVHKTKGFAAFQQTEDLLEAAIDQLWIND